MEKKHSISVIIPTYNGRNKIGNILTTLISQADVVFETIIVIDGSTDDTFNFLMSEKFKPLNLKVINQKNGGRAQSRNAGASLANGSLLIFFDDDMRLDKDTILHHLNFHIENHDALCVGQTLEDYSKSITDIQKYRAYLSRVWCEEYRANDGLVNPDRPFLTAANFSITKDLFNRLNGFDELLNDAEDFDLGVRAILAGYKIYFKHSVVGWHDDYITLKSYVKRLRQYQIAQQKLKILKPDLYATRFSTHDFNHVGILKKTIYSFASSVIMVRLIEKDILHYMLPRKVRYKIYDITITGLAFYFSDRNI